MILHDLLANEFIRAAIVLFIAWLCQMVGMRFIERLVRRLVKANRYETKVDERKREDTIIHMFHAVFVVAVWLVAIFSVLSIFKVNISGILAGAGVFSVIIGFGAQNAIKDYIAGIYILLENQYRVGDIVTLRGGTTGPQGTSGMVEEITLRITRLRDLDGTLSTVRNSEATIITNRTFKYSSVVVELNLDFASDLALVEKVVNDTGKAMLRDEALNAMVTEPLSFFRVNDLQDGYVVQVVGKVKPAAQWEVASGFRRLIVPAFIKHGIAMSSKQIHVVQLPSPAKPKTSK